MEKYKARRIQFRETVNLNEWQIKIYIIVKIGEFSHPEFYKNVLEQLPNWLTLENKFDSSNDKIGFLILHAGTEGIFSLINWWVGKNMLNTNIFITKPDRPNEFVKISGNGLAPCIWELDIIDHERTSWINNVLKQNSSPNYDKYLSDTIDKIT